MLCLAANFCTEGARLVLSQYLLQVGLRRVCSTQHGRAVGARGAAPRSCMRACKDAPLPPVGTPRRGAMVSHMVRSCHGAMVSRCRTVRSCHGAMVSRCHTVRSCHGAMVSRCRTVHSCHGAMVSRCRAVRSCHGAVVFLFSGVIPCTAL